VIAIPSPPETMVARRARAGGMAAPAACRHPHSNFNGGGLGLELRDN